MKRNINGVEFEVLDLTSMVGNNVVCDLCNKDWTNRPEPGGFVFGSSGVCPDCAPSFIDGVKRYDEEYAIKSWCPPNMSHYDFILAYRRGQVFPYTNSENDDGR